MGQNETRPLETKEPKYLLMLTENQEKPTTTSKIGAISLILFMLSSPYILLYDYFGMRLFAQILFGGIVVIFFGTKVIQEVYSGKINPLAALCLTYLCVEFIWRQDIKNLAGYAGALFLVITVSSLNTFKLKYFSKVMAYVFLLFAIAGFVQLAMVVMDPTLSLYIVKSRSVGYYGNFHFTYPIEWLGNADSTTQLFDISFPRFTSYIEQASALPSHLLLPSAIVLISGIKQRKLAYIPIFFSIASIGGSVIFCLGISAILFLFFYFRMPRPLMLMLPFIALIGLSVISYSEASISTNDPPLFEMDGKADQFETYAINRAESGKQRLIILAESINLAFSSPIFGIDKSMNEKFGSLIFTSGQRGGMLAMLVAIFAFVMLFKRVINAAYSIRGDAHTVYGLALLFSAIMQAMVYNDYGFSKFWGLTMFAVSYAMLQKLPHLRNNLISSSQNLPFRTPNLSLG